MNPASPSPSPHPRDLFLEAIEKGAPAERAAFLDGACRENAALRGAVEELLANHREDSFLEASALSLPTGIAPPSEQPGDRIGHYKLLQQIGEGGFGIVWMAEQEQPVRRRVALKIIKIGMDTREVIARFEQERQALAMMDHPNIAKVFDAGATGTGRPYFVMELVRGITITEYCDQANLPPRERLELFIAVCQAVQHAHQKGIIHRDLKPSNILVTLRDGVAVPKVIDFGVAKATQHQRLTDLTIYTQFEQMVGTPLYMSPEQAEMSGLDVDTRSDIYSLGVLLYELLTGRTPFDPETLMRQGLDEIRRAIREQEPQKPSTFVQTMSFELRTGVAQHRQTDAAKLAGLIRGDLDWIVMKAIEKDRGRRYETANGFAKDIERHLNNEPVQARPPSRAYQFQKLVRRNKLAVAATAAVTTALIIGLGAATWMFFKERAALVKEKTARERAESAEKLQSQLRQQAHAETERARRAELSAKSERQGAERQRALAEDRAQQIAHNLYASHMNVAFQAWEKGDILHVQRLLNEHHPKAGEVDMRGFEWFYLWRLCHSDQATLRGHNAQMRCVTFSPDGRLLATAGDDSLARVWDAQTGQELVTLRGHTNWVSSVAFAPDATIVATGSGDQTVRLWDASTGKELKALQGHTQAVTAIAFSSNGRLLASAAGKLPTGFGTPSTRFVPGDALPSEVKLWKVAEGTELKTLAGHMGGVTSLAISPDGKLLATGSVDQTVKLWEIVTGKMIADLKDLQVPIFAVAFSHDGRTLATGGGNPYRKQTNLRLWEVSTLKELMDFKGEHGPVFSVAFAPDDQTLATGGIDQIARLWEVASGKELGNIKGHTASIWSVAFDPGGKRLATASWDKTVKVWDTDARQGCELLPRAGSYAATFSPDAKFLVTGSSGPLTVFEVGTHKPPLEIPDSSNGDPVITFSPDGTILASAGAADKLVTFWTVGTWERLASLKGHTAGVRSLRFAPDGRTLASGGIDKTVRLWDVTERREQAVVNVHTTYVWSLAFTPDGKTLVAGSWNEIVFLDPLTGRLISKLAESGPRLAISPDGRFLALARSHLSGMKLLDLATRKTIWQVKAHQDEIWAVTFSPDGKTLATASWDGTAKLWNVASGQEMFAYNAGGVAWCVAFSPDGQWWTVGSSGPRSKQAAMFRCASAAEVEAPAKLTKAAPLVTAPALPVPPKPFVALPAGWAAALPARDAGAAPNLLDLTPYYNAPLTESWTDGDAENDLAVLPRGLQTFAGVAFDVRGLIQLRCRKSPTHSFPGEINGIRVGRACRKVHFLHAASSSWGTTNGSVIGEFVLHQPGLPRSEVPIRFNSDVRDWWVHPKQEPVGPDPALVVWRGTNSGGQDLQLFRTTWENAHPDVPVESLDYRSSMSTAAPFLIAITLE